MLTARPVFDRRPFNRSPVLRGSATFVCGIERVVDTEGGGGEATYGLKSERGQIRKDE